MTEKNKNSVESLRLGNTGQQLAAVFVFCLFSSYILNIYMSSYFGIKLTESLIFNVDDGWCNLETQGVGIHCFGDFFAFMQFDFANPWTHSVTAYPPASLLFFKALKALYLITASSNLVLYLYLAVLIAALSFPIFHLYYTKRVKSKKVCLLLLLAIFSLSPALMVIDRGNNIGFSIPLIYLALMNAIRGRDKHFLILTSILCLWKPQLGILAVFFIFSGKYKLFAQWAILTTLSYVIAFSAFGFTNTFQNIQNFIKNLIGYQGYVILPGYFPSNFSFANFIAVVINIPRHLFHNSNLNLESKLSINSISMLSAFFLLFSLCLIFYRRRIFSKLEILTLLTILSFLTPAVTFSYYLSVLLPLVTIIAYGFITESEFKSKNRSDEQIEIQNFLINLFASKKSKYIFFSVVSTCFVSWPFTWQFLGVDQGNPASKIGIVWTIGLILMNIWYFSILFRAKKVILI